MIINNKKISSNLSLEESIKSNWFGIKANNLNFIKKRLEVVNYSLLKDYKSSQYTSLGLEYNLIIPEKKNFKNRNLLSIVVLDFLMTYRGWRHIKGLPVNGQRTWSNANSCYKNNTELREFKSSLLKNSFKSVQSQNLNTIYLAEQVNLLWKNQWEDEWKEAKRRRLLIQKNNKNFAKIDLVGLASGNINFYAKGKKVEFKKNVINLGFDPGFTKNLFKINSLNSSVNKGGVIIDKSLNKVKKKKSSKLVQKQPLKAKKKKSSWE